MAEWEIHVIEYAAADGEPVVGLIQGTFAHGTVDLPFSFVLARRDAYVVLIDTGFMREGRGVELCNLFNIKRWISPIRMLRELNIRPCDVTDIVLSHAHYDHAGSIEQFRNARIHIQRLELLGWVEFLALPERFGYLTKPLDPDDIHSLIEAATEHRLVLLDGDRDNLLPGLHVRLATGHTQGQQFTILETSAGRVAISGDCVYDRCNITGTNGDGVYMPLGNGTGSAFDQLMAMDKLNDEIGGDTGRLIVIHDMRRWEDLELVEEIDGFRICRFNAR